MMEEQKRRWTLRRVLFFALKYAGVAALFFALGTAFGMYALLRNSPNLWLRNEVLALFAERQQDPGGQNAALRYWQVWQWADPEAVQAADDVELDLDNLSGELSPSQRSVLEDTSFQEFIAGVIRVSRYTECDFGFAYEEGFYARSMHVGWMRKSVRLLGTDAYLKAIDGDSADAVERIVAMFAIANHISSDRQLISSFIAGAIIEHAIGWAERLLDSGLVTKADLASIEPELRWASTWDLGMRQAIRMERSQTSISIVLLPFKSNGFSWDTEPDLKLELSLHLTGTLIEQTESIQAMYDEVLAVWDQPDCAVNLQLIEMEAQSGVYGETAIFLAPRFIRSFQVVERVRDRATKLAERLADAD